MFFFQKYSFFVNFLKFTDALSISHINYTTKTTTKNKTTNKTHRRKYEKKNNEIFLREI